MGDDFKPAVSELSPEIDGSDVSDMDENETAKLILESISDGVFTTDRECRITTFNSAAEEITGFSRKEAVGNYCFDIFRSDICHSRCALLHTMKEGETQRNVRATIIAKDGRKVPISVTTNVLHDEDGNLQGAVEFFQDLSLLESLRARITKLQKQHKMVSANEEMRRIFDLLPEVAQSDCNVLIQGPSGSGKELIAQALHDLSNRKDNAYIRVNCAALPETLLESELFGYVKGAFTDAKRDKPGLFLLADRGSLLLDEIAEMPLALQVKLLRVLQNGEFQPLGSTRGLKSDVRVLCSTNRDVERMVREGAFREDLFYRINVIHLRVPPLKDRLEDLPLLVEHFIKQFSEKRGKAISGISAEALNVLRCYDFPGNVRELENAIEHAFVLCRGDVIQPEHLPDKILNSAREKEEDGEYRAPRLPRGSEEAIIREALERHDGNRGDVADELGMHRTTLWRKMKKYGIEAEEESQDRG